jgi:hypothetical protein
MLWPHSYYGRRKCYIACWVGPSIVHMKRYINPIQSDDWTKELVWENTNPFRIIHNSTVGIGTLSHQGVGK